MAIEKKPKHLEDDTLYAKRQEDERNWGEFGPIAEETFKNWMKYQEGMSGKKAKTPLEVNGRACFRCAGSLMIFDETDNGYLMLKCRSCGQHQYHTDIEPYSEEEMEQVKEEAAAVGAKPRHLPDELYRTIPDSLVLEYTEMRKKRKRG